MKITITAVGHCQKVEIDLGDGGTLEVHGQTPAPVEKPANPATDLSKPYPLPTYPVPPISAVKAEAERIAATPAPAVVPDPPAPRLEAVAPAAVATKLVKSELARAWGKSLKRGPRGAVQKAEDAAWEAAGRPATSEVLDAHGKAYQTNPDGTALFPADEDEATTDVTESVSVASGQEPKPDMEAARQAKLDEDFGPAADEFGDDPGRQHPADIEEDEFGPPVTKPAAVATKAAPTIAGIPPEVFDAVEVKDILKPLAAAGIGKAAIMSFIEANHQKLKPLARLPLDTLLPRMARALDQLKVV